ncbi:hypothetical protein P3X46_000145 [Hevea brasiliensis]|uniref:Uncharacterized protein n=1 Tax=Hevea brasiliensis TaxID=3981 RepID=A0ABQ9NAY4_HEVBR|nr:hypothetical protein P3X46_000145 [Hevea brasiliensis]
MSERLSSWPFREESLALFSPPFICSLIKPFVNFLLASLKQRVAAPRREEIRISPIILTVAIKKPTALLPKM